MLDDKQFEDLIRPISNIYSDIEYELLMEIATRFKNYDSLSGSLEWYTKKLDELGGLNQEAVRIIAKYSNKTEKEVKRVLEKAGYDAVPLEEYKRIYDAGGMPVDPSVITITRVLENSFVESKELFKLINTKAVEGTTKAYMDVLNQAYLEVSGGYYDYNTSIQKACKKMADKGISCATYQRSNGKTFQMSIESVVRRDTLTSINQTANKANDKFIDELKAKHVYVTEHAGARNKGVGWKNHESWQGKVYLIEGSDDKYKNFAATTGYGKVDGLAGVNCRHSHYAFFPGFSVIPESPSYNPKLYDLTQKQRYFERGIRKWKKQLAIYEGLEDDVNIIACKKKVKEWQNNLQKFIDDHEELKRDYSREKVY